MNLFLNLSKSKDLLILFGHCIENLFILVSISIAKDDSEGVKILCTEQMKEKIIHYQPLDR